MSLRVQIVHLLKGNIVFNLSQLGVVIALAKIGDASMVGTYALAQAITVPVFAFAQLGLRNVIATDVEYQYDASTYIYLLALLLLIATSICIVITKLINIPNVVLFTVLTLIVVRIFDSASFIVYGFLQRSGRMDLISKSLVLRGVVGLTGMVVLLVITEKIYLAVLMIACLWGLIFLIIDYRNFKLIIKNLATLNLNIFKQLYHLFLKSLPLGILSLITAFSLNVPRFYVEHFSGIEQLGFFAAVIALANAGAVLVNSIGQSITPQLARTFLEDKNSFVRLLAKATILAGIIGIAGVMFVTIFGQYVLEIVYTSEYAKYKVEFIAAMVWATLLFISVTLGCGLTATQKFITQTLLSIVTLFVIAVAAYILVGMYGIIGAIAAMAIGLVVRITLQVIILHRVIFSGLQLDVS